MSDRKVINANDFINKAVKIVEIDGFDEGDKIAIKIKPVSLLAMMTKGKLPNELKAQVASLFNQKNDGAQQLNLNDVEQLTLMHELMDKVCADCMIEPSFNEVGEYMTDIQKTQVFTFAQGNLSAYTPTDKEQ